MYLSRSKRSAQSLKYCSSLELCMQFGQSAGMGKSLKHIISLEVLTTKERQMLDRSGSGDSCGHKGKTTHRVDKRHSLIRTFSIIVVHKLHVFINYLQLDLFICYLFQKRKMKALQRYSIINPELATRLICEMLFNTHLKSPQATNVITAFKADRHQALINTDLDTGQTRTACSNHCHSSNHC